jgi:hypothetical protein
MAAIAEHKQESKDLQVAILREKAAATVVNIWAAQGRYGEYIQRRAVGDRILCGEYITQRKDELKRTLHKINELNGHVPKNGITQEMIDQAKAFPFQQLFEFRNKSARCPFHDDHDPSFVLMKDNTVRCFGACGKSWDTIDFLMEREGKTFQEAVRALQW